MRVLIGLIQAKKTVVSQNAELKVTWIFRSDGTCSLIDNLKPVEELQGREAFYMFDTKVGQVEEPPRRNSKLLLFSSTNQSSYKQTMRRSDVELLLFPSTTKAQFERFGKIFQLSMEDIEYRSRRYGHDKVRILTSTIRKLEYQRKSAMEKFKVDQLLTYASAFNTSVGNAEENPSNLLDANICDANDLYQRYNIGHARWRIASESIRNELLDDCRQKALAGLASLLVSTTRTEQMQILGVSTGRIVELLTPYYISKYGMRCERFVTDTPP